MWVDCPTPEAKYRSIANIYGVITIGQVSNCLRHLVDKLLIQAMIFCHTRKTVNWLVEKMTAEGHAVALLSGELTVEERLIVLDRYPLNVIQACSLKM